MSGNLRRLIVASGASNVADGSLQVALPLVALTITRDPGAFAIVSIAGRLPWLLVALPAGALADRLDRRRTMVFVNTGRMALLAALTAVVASGGHELWMLAATAFVLGVGETLYDTSAQSILPHLVAEPAGLERANGRLYAVELTANQFLGPAVGGIATGIALAAGVGTSTVAYLVGAIVLVTISGRFQPSRAAPTSLRRDIVDGVRYLASHRLLRALALVVGISNLASSATFAVFPLYAVQPGPVGLGSAGFGFLMAAIAAGSVAGSFIAAPMVERLGSRRTLLAAMGVGPIYFVVPAVTSSVAWIATAFVVASAIGVSWNIITVSLRQRIVPDHLLGRVNAGYRLLAWGTMPLGAALGGLIGAQVSLPAVFWTSAGFSALCVPIVWSQATPDRLAAGVASELPRAAVG